MNKYYVRDYAKKSVDGDRLQRVKTYESQPKRHDYIVWVRK